MRHLRPFFSSLIFTAFVLSPATAQGAPNFSPGRYIRAGDVPIAGNNAFSAPAVADWNGDGRKDLLLGVFYEGNIWLYLNQGTDDDPVFIEGTLLEADGEPIQVGFG